ncbi:MAG: hypothetical protein EXQ87_01730 [Alphaproteobacteria bacterium]|nr:hypothetical protein [Alphaproteobacteria bacterium]
MNLATKIERADDEAVQVIERIVQDRLGPFDIKGVRVEPGLDHCGDPILFIEVRYRKSRKPVDASVTFGLVTEVREALEAVGETRFPHVRHRFDHRRRIVNAS